jgi:hypothetical protein
VAASPATVPAATHVFEDDALADEPVRATPAAPTRVAPRPVPRPERRTVVFDDDDELDVPDFLK